MVMKLVDDVGNLWRRWSTRIAASQLGLVAFWLSLPQDLRDAVPRVALGAVVALLALAFISAQAVKQKKLQTPNGGE
jgi:hypothetical protein